MARASVSTDGRTRPDGLVPRIIRPLELVSHTVHSDGVSRLPAITHELVGADKLWMGMTILEPGMRTAPHHHGARETGIYLVAGRVRLRWGPRLEGETEVEAGDLVFLPPHLAHDETNQSADEAAVWVAVWDGSNTFVPLVSAADGVYRPDPRG